MRVTFENVESFELNVYALGQKKKGTTVEVCFGILSCSVLQNIQSNRREAKKKRKMKLSPIFLYLLHFCALSNTRQRTICKLAQWNSLLKHLDLFEFRTKAIWEMSQIFWEIRTVYKSIASFYPEQNQRLIYSCWFINNEI